MASRTELSGIDGVLADPLIRAVMKADRIDASEMEGLLRDVGRRLAASRHEGVARTAKDGTVHYRALPPADRDAQRDGDPTKAFAGYNAIAARRAAAACGFPR